MSDSIDKIYGFGNTDNNTSQENNVPSNQQPQPHQPITENQVGDVIGSDPAQETKLMDKFSSIINDIENGKNVSYDESVLNSSKNNDVKHMENILSAFNGEGTISNNEKHTDEKKSLSEGKNTKISNDEKEESKRLMSLFEDSAKSASKEIVNESNSSSEIREGLNSYEDYNDNKIKFKNNYSIKYSYLDEDNNKKIYDVIDEKNNIIVAKNLYLYESAYSIVNNLNKGKNYLDPKIRYIIYLEEKYVRNRIDTIHYKQKIKEAKKNNSPKINVYEAKYGKAKSNAKFIKNHIKKHIKDVNND